MISLEKYSIRSTKVTWRVIDEDVFIINSESNKIHKLNKVGSFIWKSSEGQITIKQIIDLIWDRFDVSQAVAENDTREFIEKMLAQGLMELTDTPSKT